MVQPSALRELRITDVSGGLSAFVERIPPVTGVYAWFRNVVVEDKGTGDDYFAALLERAAHTYGVSREDFLGPSLHVTVTPRTDAADRSLDKLKAACADPAFRIWMQGALGAVSNFLPPLYVGATVNLRVRVGQHLAPGSPLRDRLTEAKINLDEVTLRYMMLPQLAAGATDGLDKEVECVIAYLLVPGFSIRYG